MSNFVHDIWYFAATIDDLPKSGLHRVIIAGEPICLVKLGAGRKGEPDSYQAIRDICPHRAAPFSAGCIKAGKVE